MINVIHVKHQEMKSNEEENYFEVDKITILDCFEDHASQVSLNTTQISSQDIYLCSLHVKVQELTHMIG